MLRVLLLVALMVAFEFEGVGGNIIRYRDGQWYLPDDTKFEQILQELQQFELLPSGGAAGKEAPVNHKPPTSAPAVKKARKTKPAPKPKPAQVSGADKEFLDAHNSARRNEAKLPAMVWDPELASLARQTAQKCKLAHDHYGQKTSLHDQLGQNVYYSSSTDMTDTEAIEDAVKEWMKEKKFYTFASRHCSAVCGHYTQVVWKTTTHLGCAVSKGCDGATFVACDYAPPGNWQGQDPY